MADQGKLAQVRAVIKLAEKWSEDQVMPQSQIAISALRDIQRIVGKEHVKSPREGVLALCSLGCLGLITEDKPKEVVYGDGNKGMAWIGIHLTDKVRQVGDPWSSRAPKVLCCAKDLC